VGGGEVLTKWAGAGETLVGLVFALRPQTPKHIRKICNKLCG
jgi:hypothetical protein